MALSNLLCRAKSLEIQHRALPRYPDAHAAAAEQTRLTSPAAPVGSLRVSYFLSRCNFKELPCFRVELIVRETGSSFPQPSWLLGPGQKAAFVYPCLRSRGWRGARRVGGRAGAGSASSPVADAVGAAALPAVFAPENKGMRFSSRMMMMMLITNN